MALSEMGSIRVGSWQEPDNVNPFLTHTASGVWFGIPALEPLVRPTDVGSFTPVIAARVPDLENGDVLNEGQSIIWHLKRDVRWADGMPLHAGDIRFTWEALMAPGNEVDFRRGYDRIAAVDVRDPWTAEIRFHRPYAGYPLLFLAVLPKHAFGGNPLIADAAYNRTPYGTGPFFAEEWIAGKHILYRRNPFFRGSGPHVDRVVIRFFKSQNDVLESLLGGDIDIALSLSPEHIVKCSDRVDVRIIARASTHIERIICNLKDPVLSDVRVRRAIDHAISRRRLIEELGFGMLEPVVSELDGSPWFSPFAGRDHDPPQAVALLEEAGWALGADGVRVRDDVPLKLTISAPEGDLLRERAVSSVTEMLRAVGIHVSATFHRTRDFFGRHGSGGLLAQGHYQLAIVSAGMFGDPEPHYAARFHSMYIPDVRNGFTGGNWAGYRASDVDALLEQASEAQVRSERKTIYARVEQRIHEDCPIIYLYRRPLVHAVKRGLVGVQTLPFIAVWDVTWSIADWRWADG